MTTPSTPATATPSQAEICDRLRKAARQKKPDAQQVLKDIAALALGGGNENLAIKAAQACVAAKQRQYEAAMATTHLPDDDEWERIMGYFGLDTSFCYDEERQLDYARAYRAEVA